MKIILKVIIKQLFLILSYRLAYLGLALGSGTVGKGRDGSPGTGRLPYIPFPDGTRAPGGVVPVPGEAYSTAMYVGVKIKIVNNRGHDRVSFSVNISLYYVDLSVR